VGVVGVCGPSYYYSGIDGANGVGGDCPGYAPMRGGGFGSQESCIMDLLWVSHGEVS
jgi:hypothetical protein